MNFGSTLVFKLMVMALLPLPMVSCSNSPLFNHKNESDIRAKNDKTGKAESNCSIHQGIDICFVSGWIVGPEVTSINTLKIEFYLNDDPDKKLVSVEDLFVELWMPVHDHGSSPTEIEDLDGGGYLIKEIWFSMPGFWEIRIFSKGKRIFTVEARV